MHGGHTMIKQIWRQMYHFPNDQLIVLNLGLCLIKTSQPMRWDDVVCFTDVSGMERTGLAGAGMYCMSKLTGRNWFFPWVVTPPSFRQKFMPCRHVCIMGIRQDSGWPLSRGRWYNCTSVQTVGWCCVLILSASV